MPYYETVQAAYEVDSLLWNGVSSRMAVRTHLIDQLGRELSRHSLVPASDTVITVQEPAYPGDYVRVDLSVRAMSSQQGYRLVVVPWQPSA